MRILVVGGTGFLGGAAAFVAVNAGHNVTVMSRGGDKVAPGAAVIVADREKVLPDMQGQFDVVIDTCAYAPGMVTRMCNATGPAHYILVSSISVYDDMSVPECDETTPAPAATSADLALASQVPVALRGTAGPYGASYGRLKRSCELAAQAAFGDNCAIIRLGLIVGPEDYTDRFTWWVRRCDAGGDLAVPGPNDRKIQMIDVRDAAAFLLRLAAQRMDGTFHVTGTPMTIEQMLMGIQSQTGVPIKAHYGPLSAFTDAGLRHWTDLPLILPDTPALAQMLNVSVAKAKAAGLTERSFADTVQSVLARDRTRRDAPLKCGMSQEAEKSVLRALAQPRT